jgi:arsenite methyltransferase
VRNYQVGLESPNMSDSLICEPLSPERAADIRIAIKTKYRSVSLQPEGHFPYPVGRESALSLGYETAWIDSIPVEVSDRFVGVGNPFGLRKPYPGAHVLDIGCGCGMDTLIAASLAGEEGRSIGLDLTEEMLGWARSAAAAMGRRVKVDFLAGSADILPFADAAFDLVISNGALNLVPDKAAAFSEIARVLRPGGALAAADLLVMETIPPEVLASKDAWST